MALNPFRLRMLSDRFRRDESGATAVEYSLIAAGIAGAVVAAVYTLGASLNTDIYGKIIAAWH